ncbi:hypothetical protein Cgig2_001222 [Carnegiea gigantea]|uniref:Diacylglycerol O-acyltransferase n=1 Tax=Carnegiea gigantea TaxID=171969 RepID=A0A9Q1JZL1_9CARY|nr:hypothetical protein Cgig2_001222 [Carnegiea gigantea]
MEAAVNAYLANLAVSNPLSENKPLWEVHALLGLNCIVLRVQHALGDGTSLMCMLSACFGKQRDGVVGEMKKKTEGEKKGRKWRKGGVWGRVRTTWFTLVFAMKDLGLACCVKDKRSVIYGGKGVELWPRKLETVEFQLQDFKSIKKIIPNATINDVLLGIISSGLSKYLHVKSRDELLHGLQLTAIVPVNLRKKPGLQELADLMRANTWWCGSSSWGNKTSAVFQPVHCCNGLYPLDHVKRMKAIMDQKKLSYEAHMAYVFGKLILPCLGPKALVMYMVSYAGKADLQVMVAKDIISDSQFLIECFKESLLGMKSSKKKEKKMSEAKANHGDDEALSSPYCRISLCPKTEQIINCAMGLRHPIDVDAVKKAFSESVMIEHPRFCSLVVRDHAKEYWRKTCVNIDDHFIIVHPTTTNVTGSEEDMETAVNAYMANLAVSNPLSENKPLWEVHVLLGLNCVVLRVHHALGDGASLMSMLSACFGKQRDGVMQIENGDMKKKAKGEKKWRKGGVWGLVRTTWFTLVFAMEDLGLASCVKDKRSLIYGGKGVEFWPRKLETVKFQLQDFTSIKKVIPNATINDVLLGIISSGLSKYLYVKSCDELLQGLQVTAIIPINLRKKLGLQALVMYMVSYAGKADLQVMVAKDIISDSQFLIQCFKESLLEMKSSVGGGNN